jgi:hypothetical protein
MITVWCFARGAKVELVRLYSNRPDLQERLWKARQRAASADEGQAEPDEGSVRGRAGGTWRARDRLTDEDGCCTSVLYLRGAVKGLEEERLRRACMRLRESCGPTGKLRTLVKRMASAPDAWLPR